MATAQTVVLHMKNGDRLAGTLVSEDTNRVVITTPWIKELAVPVGQIERRETFTAQTETNLAPATPLAGPKPTNALPLNPASPIAVAGVPPPSTNKPPKRWSGEARIGADFLYGANSQQIYSGRLKLAYQRPYASDPKEFFRDTFDLTADYGWTKSTPTSGGTTTNSSTGATNTSSGSSSVLSANRVDGNDKVEVDIGKRWYLYSIAGAGYDEVLKINFRDQIGPGLGYRISRDTNFVVNAEMGFDYEEEYRTDQPNVHDFYYRVAENIAWKVNKKLTYTEKFEYLPQFPSYNYRFRFESTLSYALWQNITLNLTALDLYNTQPALGVPENDLQIRSLLGLKF
jgi:hypothetical protein